MRDDKKSQFLHGLIRIYPWDIMVIGVGNNTLVTLHTDKPTSWMWWIPLISHATITDMIELSTRCIPQITESFIIS